MATIKAATLTFRFRPRLKEALRMAADREGRSIENMVEVLALDYCEKCGIAIPSSEKANNNSGLRARLKGQRVAR